MVGPASCDGQGSELSPRLSTVPRRFASRRRELQLDFFYLNTHRPLFSNVRVRQAVNYAIDRRALAAAGNGGQALPDTPTDHYLPPGMPGYRAVHVYPLAPNLAKARQLITAAHATGSTAVLYTLDFPAASEQAQIVKNDLARIGIQVQIHTFPSGRYFSQLATPGAPFDLAYDGWLADYPDPDDFLNNLLDNSSNGPTFDDPLAQRRMAAAARLSGPERYLTYGALDLDLARSAAPWPRSATAPATTSSRRGSAARRSGSTVWTSPRSAPELPRHSDQEPRPGA